MCIHTRGEVDYFLCHIVKHWLITLCAKCDEILVAIFKITVKTFGLLVCGHGVFRGATLPCRGRHGICPRGQYNDNTRLSTPRAQTSTKAPYRGLCHITCNLKQVIDVNCAYELNSWNIINPSGLIRNMAAAQSAKNSVKNSWIQIQVRITTKVSWFLPQDDFFMPRLVSYVPPFHRILCKSVE